MEMTSYRVHRSPADQNVPEGKSWVGRQSEKRGEKEGEVGVGGSEKRGEKDSEKREGGRARKEDDEEGRETEKRGKVDGGRGGEGE